jgi:hypothetical protein
MIVTELPKSAAAAQRLLKITSALEVSSRRSVDGIPFYMMTYRNPYTGEYLTLFPESLSKGGTIYASRVPVIFEAYSYTITYRFDDHCQCIKMRASASNRRVQCLLVHRVYNDKFIALFRKFVELCVLPNSVLGDIHFNDPPKQLEEGIQLKDY